MDLSKNDPSPALAPAKPGPTYVVQAGLDGEVFPVFANFASLQDSRDRGWGTVAVTLTNSSDSALHDRIVVQVEGWSDQEIQNANVAAGEVRTFLFAPTFLARFYDNHEIVAATASVSITNDEGRQVFHGTVPLRLRSADDMYWGPNFKYAPFIASWVTPHDRSVEEILSLAKESMPGRRLPGYEDWKSPSEQQKSTWLQAQAIYNALQQKGVSYVKSSMTFGRHADVAERVRMPRESLGHVSANCIDGAVMYASLFENLGMEPVIVLVPGHSYVGVRTSEGGEDYLYIETSLTGRASFDSSVQAAAKGLGRFKPNQITKIRIEDARQAGIYPMPEPSWPGATPAAPVQTSLK